MSCNIKAFRDRKVTEAINLVYNSLSPAYRLHKGNSVIITPRSGSKIKTQNQAFRAAEAMEKKIAKKFGKDFKFDVYGKWTTIYKSPSDVRLEVKIPPNLLKAYEAKEAKKQSEHYATTTATLDKQQDNFDTFFDMPASLRENQINTPAYIKYKTSLIQGVDSKLRDLKAQRRQKYTAAISRRIHTLNTLKEKLLEDIQEIKKSADVVQVLEEQISNDLDVLDDLLQGKPSIEDLHSAEEIISYYSSMADYKSDSGNQFLRLSEIYDADKKLILDPSIKTLLDNTLIQINAMASRLADGKETYLQDLVDNSAQIQAYQDKRKEQDPSVEDFEISELLQELDDIGWADREFLTIDKQFGRRDSLLAQLMKIELEFKRSDTKSESAKLVKAIDVALKRADSSLKKLASPVKTVFGLISNRDYSPFYRKNAIGDNSNVLVSKYTQKWENAKKKIFYHTYQLKRNAISLSQRNVANKKEFDWIDSNANFLDFTKINAIRLGPEFSPLIGQTDVTDEDALEYENYLKEELGEEFFHRIVKEQIEHLSDFTNMTAYQYENNPFHVLRSKKAGLGGKILTPSGVEVVPSPRFNSYYPKKTVKVYRNNALVDEPSGYYDETFKEIEKDIALLELWKAFEKAVEYINDNVTDATNNLQHGSILAMKKGIGEILVGKGEQNRGRGVQISEWLGDSLKNLFTQSKTIKNASETTTINKSQFKTNNNQIKLRLDTFMLKYENTFKGDPTKVIDLDDVSQDMLDFFGKELNTETVRKDLIATLGRAKVTPVELAKVYITDQVNSENSQDLPTILRAYLEMTAEYKAQRDSQPKIEIYKQFYDNIKKKTIDTREKGWVKKSLQKIRKENNIGLERVNAKARLNYWYNKNVKGSLDSAPTWGVISTTYTKHEKDLIAEIDEKLKDKDLPVIEREMLEAEKIALGSNITMAAAFNAVIIKWSLFKGLGYSLKSSTINRFQGWFQGEVNDGKYWTKNNFPTANSFIMRKVLRYSPTSRGREYKKEIDKTRLMIDALNILQDATNELDRAKDKSGIKGAKKVLNPYYLTEYTEWHNQTPQILAMLMDKKIKDKDGNEVRIFTGKAFPAHDIKDGFLVLKPEFAAREGNIETWQNFSNEEAANNKLYMSEVIGLVNGDYSKTGTIKVKKSPIGRSLMLFKSWMPNFLWNRLASKQANLILGKPDQEGFYKSHRVASLGITLGALGLLSYGPVVAGVGAIGGVIYGGYLRKTRNTPIGEEIGILRESAVIALSLLQRMTPFLKSRVNLESITHSEEDAKNLNAVLTEMSVLLTLVSGKIMMQALIGNDDEDEPKTLPEGTDNPYYLENIQSDATIAAHNFIENESTRLIADIANIQSPLEFGINQVKNMQVLRTAEDVLKLAYAMDQLAKGQDRISTGINAGDSRALNATQKLLLPGIFKPQLGFGPSMEQEYDNREYFDSYFYSDYRADRKSINNDRSALREAYTKEYREIFEYDNVDKKTQKLLDAEIKTIVNELVELEAPYPHRLMYDEKQNKVDLSAK